MTEFMKSTGDLFPKDILHLSLAPLDLGDGIIEKPLFGIGLGFIREVHESGPDLVKQFRQLSG